MFSFGSILAAFAQGLILGGFIQGVEVADNRFAGGTFDWFTPYTLLVAVGLVCGYALLGAAWLMGKTTDALHGDARRWTLFAGVLTALFLLGVSLSTLVVHPLVAERWGWTGAGFDLARFLPLSLIPLAGLAGLATVALGVARRSHVWPFVGAVLVFLSGYGGLAMGFFPYVAPYAVDFRTAAAPDNALALMLFGTAFILPLILAYTAWVYWVFRGKVTPEAGYH
jgi:cytochrome d ubiquinol oxidase subunit II